MVTFNMLGEDGSTEWTWSPSTDVSWTWVSDFGEGDLSSTVSPAREVAPLNPQGAVTAILAEAKTRLKYQVGLWMQRYLMLLIVVLGLVGNTLSLLVLRRPRNRRISCCVYMEALAVLDNCVLLLGGYSWVISEAQDRQIDFIECQIYVYVLMVTSTSSVWVVVAMTVDRYLAVCWPLRSLGWCSVRRARHLTAAILLACLVFNLPVIFTASLHGKWICAAFGGDDVIHKVFSWGSFCVSSLAPFLTILILNCFIIRAVRRSQSELRMRGLNAPPTSSPQTAQPASGKQTAQSRDQSHDHQLTMTLLAVSLAFLILVLPQYSRFLVYSFLDRFASADSYAWYYLLVNIAHKLYHANNAVNFVLYVITGTRFRRDLKEMFLCCGCSTTWGTVKNTGSLSVNFRDSSDACKTQYSNTEF